MQPKNGRKQMLFSHKQHNKLVIFTLMKKCAFKLLGFMYFQWNYNKVKKEQKSLRILEHSNMSTLWFQIKNYFITLENRMEFVLNIKSRTSILYWILTFEYISSIFNVKVFIYICAPRPYLWQPQHGREYVLTINRQISKHGMCMQWNAHGIQPLKGERVKLNYLEQCEWTWEALY